MASKFAIAVLVAAFLLPGCASKVEVDGEVKHTAGISPELYDVMQRVIYLECLAKEAGMDRDEVLCRSDLDD